MADILEDPNLITEALFQCVGESAKRCYESPSMGTFSSLPAKLVLKLYVQDECVKFTCNN